MLELVAKGLSNEQIAARLGVHIETVKSHVQAVLLNLGARNRAHAVALGFKARILLI